MCQTCIQITHPSGRVEFTHDRADAKTAWKMNCSLKYFDNCDQSGHPPSIFKRAAARVRSWFAPRPLPQAV